MKNYHTLHPLYIELVKLQREIISTKKKVLIILEGRDAAGKDGTIKKIIKHLSPRETKVVALNKPSDIQNSQWYFERYVSQLPAKGEIVIFNRSWYNRAGVEWVMGFCTKTEYANFFVDVPLFEKMLVNDGFIIIKYYLDISKDEQSERLQSRKNDPLKQWKTSPIDNQAQKLWDKYSDARNSMLLHTNFKYAPWFIADANDKKALHEQLITHLLCNMDYKNKDKKLNDKKTELIFPASASAIKNRLFK